MKAFKFIVLAFILIINLNVTYAAILKGNVYDLNLKKVDDVIVEIDTTPVQRMVALEGSYSFSVPAGDYKISAKYSENGIIKDSTEELISISAEGEYVYDLFLFPDMSIEDEIATEASGELVEDMFENNYLNNLLTYGIIIGLFVIGFYIFYRFFMTKKNNPKTENDSDVILNLIEKNEGRITQKQLRKEIPLSEAKISLMLSELEYKNKIEKIKKGRGNIIILK